MLLGIDAHFRGQEVDNLSRKCCSTRTLHYHKQLMLQSIKWNHKVCATKNNSPNVFLSHTPSSCILNKLSLRTTPHHQKGADWSSAVTSSETYVIFYGSSLSVRCILRLVIFRNTFLPWQHRACGKQWKEERRNNTPELWLFWCNGC